MLNDLVVDLDTSFLTDQVAYSSIEAATLHTVLEPFGSSGYSTYVELQILRVRDNEVSKIGNFVLQPAGCRAFVQMRY